MSKQPKPVDDHTVTPYLVVRGVAGVLEFMKTVFGAVERMQPVHTPDGKVGHAEMVIGNSIIMLGEPMPEQPVMPGVLYVRVDNVDAVYARALAAGARSVRGPADQFYGHRNAGVTDAAGNQWWMSRQIEDISEAELLRRAREAMK
jgi:PhnB protein